MKQTKENFRCRRCGYCCTQIVVLSPKELEEIKQLGHDENAFSTIDDTGRKRLRRLGYYCYFMTLDKGVASCKIYDKRPKICRQYPFFGKKTAECFPSRFSPGVVF